MLASERVDAVSYRWTLSTRDGTALGEMISETSYLPFEVQDRVLLFVTGLRLTNNKGEVSVEMPTLVAFDLAKGARIWTREIRDTVYRGPFPP